MHLTVEAERRERQEDHKKFEAEQEASHAAKGAKVAWAANEREV